ncbi:hypothetical protein HUO09_16770 [Vibrio sp. Y2-5]|uniref:hypothetical protein n=1 Tax=Vibrio sp. Y2-5 TaxID=2743977 RepID=UPI001660EF61|nr:hypothetical protein [Vibrio sp. Y2-5]MBD0788008.1 hypothetical protein [Vibrio sp. Y2-5]
MEIILNSKGTMPVHRFVVDKAYFLMYGHYETVTILSENTELVVTGEQLTPIDDYKMDYPNVSFISHDEFDTLSIEYEDILKTRVKRISQEAYNFMMGYVDARPTIIDGLTFFITEHEIRANLVNWVCCFNKVYFEFIDEKNRESDYIVERAKQEYKRVLETTE